jgi:hypothetical protein
MFALAAPNGYAWRGQREQPMMQARFSADITNDGNEDVLILDGYIEGTTPQIPFTERIDAPAGETVMGENIFVFDEPVVGEGGKDFTGKVILPDQCETRGEPLLLPHFFSEWTKRSGIGTSRSSQSFGRNPILRLRSDADDPMLQVHVRPCAKRNFLLSQLAMRRRRFISSPI